LSLSQLISIERNQCSNLLPSATSAVPTSRFEFGLIQSADLFHLWWRIGRIGCSELAPSVARAPVTRQRICINLDQIAEMRKQNGASMLRRKIHELIPTQITIKNMARRFTRSNHICPMFNCPTIRLMLQPCDWCSVRSRTQWLPLRHQIP
jgi:hypothetical protein